jgi:hypothetical protein
MHNLATQQLDGHPPPKIQVLGHHHGTHAPRPQYSLDAKATAEDLAWQGRSV